VYRLRNGLITVVEIGSPEASKWVRIQVLTLKHLHSSGGKA
jgi:hypothetical protein